MTLGIGIALLKEHARETGTIIEVAANKLLYVVIDGAVCEGKGSIF